MSDVLKDIVPWLALAVARVSLAFAMHTARSKRISDCERLIVELKQAVAERPDAVAIGGLTGKLGMIEDETIRLRAEIAHMPDRDSMHRLEVMMLTMQREVAVLAEGVKPIKAIAVRLQEAILEKAQERQ